MSDHTQRLAARAQSTLEAAFELRREAQLLRLGYQQTLTRIRQDQMKRGIIAPRRRQNPG